MGDGAGHHRGKEGGEAGPGGKHTSPGCASSPRKMWEGEDRKGKVTASSRRCQNRRKDERTLFKVNFSSAGEEGDEGQNLPGHLEIQRGKRRPVATTGSLGKKKDGGSPA